MNSESIQLGTKPIALLGGIYNNYLALEVALRDAEQRGIQDIFCLGDLGAFGPHPNRVFPLLREYDVQCIQGNYDNSIANNLADCQCGYTDPRDNYFAQISYSYTFENTNRENREWLATLPDSLQLKLGNYSVRLCHGSPRRMNEFLWESTTSSHFLGWMLDQACADVAFGTHTGIKWHRRLEGDRHFVNVGVLGRPENDGKTNVWYTIARANPGLQVEFVPIHFDHERLAHEMRAEELPEEFCETIETGWWTTCLEILPSKERRRGKF